MSGTSWTTLTGQVVHPIELDTAAAVIDTESQGCARPFFSHWDWDRDLADSVSRLRLRLRLLAVGIESWDWDWDFWLLVSKVETETETFHYGLKYWDWDFSLWSKKLRPRHQICGLKAWDQPSLDTKSMFKKELLFYWCQYNSYSVPALGMTKIKYVLCRDNM